jgi:dienelactone hydrolase
MSMLRFKNLSLLSVAMCAALCARAQEAVSVTSTDGTALQAWKFDAQPINAPSAIQKRPVVVALHGCGGLYANIGARKGQLNARHQAMGEMLQAQGYHVVFPDSLTARGESSLCTQPIGSRKVTQRERRADALGTLAWLWQQPWADPARVAVLGWSHGASAVLAVTAGQRRQLNGNGLPPFTTALAFYPGCSQALATGYEPNTNITFFLGADDDWTPPGPCIELAQKLQAQQSDADQAQEQKPKVDLHVYPGAVHDFDNPLPGVREIKAVPSRVHSGKGVMAGQNPAAREASWAQVREILRDAFR